MPHAFRSSWLVFLLLLLPYAYFDHNEGWNQTSRLAELHSIVIKGTLNIDAYHIFTGDKALIDGHYYSEKAPAATLIALPSFAAAVVAQRMMGIDPDGGRAWAASAWVATACSVGLVAALGGVAFFTLIRRRMSDRLALVATVGVWLGTLALPYATSLFAHSTTMGLLAIMLWGTLDSDSPVRRRDEIAGMAAGLAVASEYPAIFAVAGMALYLWRLDRKRATRFALALLPGLLLILVKNALLTGNPFVVGYGSKPEFPNESASHNYGYGMPSLAVVGELLWGPYRGLFFWSPILLMALPGLAVLARRDRALAVLIVGASTLSLVQVASFYNWFGGFSVGPRYLAPSFPLLGLAAAYGIAAWPRLGALLTVWSVGLMLMTTAVDLAPPEAVMNPLRDYYFHRIEQGRLAPNVGTLAGLSPVPALLLLLAGLGLLGWLFLEKSRAFPDWH